MEPNSPVTNPSSSVSQPIQNVHSMPSSSNKKWAAIILVLIVLLIIFTGGAYYLGKNQNLQKVEKGVKTNIISPSLTLSSTLAPSYAPATTHNWKTYQSVKYNFGFLYPENWITSENLPQGPYEPFSVTVTNPNDNFQFIFNSNIYGVGGQCDDNPNHDLGYSSLTFIKRPFYLFFYGDKAKDMWSTGYLSDRQNPCPNIAFFDISEIGGINSQTNTRGGLEALTIRYKGKEFVNFNEFKNSGNLEIAKEILNSFY